MRIPRSIREISADFEAQFVEYKNRFLQWFVKRSPMPEHVAEVEKAVGQAFVPVRTPPEFRRYLGQNLALAAWRKGANLEVEHPRPPRFWLAVTAVSAGILAAMATLLIAFRPRSNAPHE